MRDLLDDGVAGTRLLKIDRIAAASLADEPYQWGHIDGLFDDAVAAQLVSTYPTVLYRTVIGDDGEKAYEHEARALIPMGGTRPTRPEHLSSVWHSLANELVSAPYRSAMSTLTGCDLTTVPIEANLLHYGPGAALGAHSDLADKLVTHVLYFNTTWDPALGGCLRILRSPDIDDVVSEIAPIVGSSTVIVRSERSYHGLSPVSPSSAESRRSMTVTFYRPGSVSPMWPPGEHVALHSCGAKATD